METKLNKEVSITYVPAVGEVLVSRSMVDYRLYAFRKVFLTNCWHMVIDQVNFDLGTAVPRPCVEIVDKQQVGFR